MIFRCGCLGLLAIGSMMVRASDPIEHQHPKTGPRTEQRFPPLKVPPEFKATLFACDPFIEYPSVIARGPRQGTLFVAIDYMTGLGREIIRRDEIRLIEDSNGDGYADKSTVYAKGFNSIQGLEYHDGTVYVMHAPYLTALRDGNADGKADQRRDLITGLGLPPEKNPVRLHCANGVVMGHDGWLYLALGDNGCRLKRVEGDMLIIEGGGILRCRPDGRDLHVFSRGLRNIYDVALDAELNVFVRDNENDGGTYMIRVCHSFFDADHGYPYLYYEHPEEALSPLADLGRGSSAGGVAYSEPQFPAEYRNNLFFCEWGRAVVRGQLTRNQGWFAPLKEIDFAAGSPKDPYGFKPTDLVVDHDGSLLVSDWADGQRPKRGRGRIYRISARKLAKATRPIRRKAGLLGWVEQLNSPSYLARVEAQNHLLRQDQKVIPILKKALKRKQLGVRGRMHAVWILARAEKSKGLPTLFALARTDPNVAVRGQAIRAIADLTDPVFVKHRLNAGSGSLRIAKRLADLTEKQDSRIVREIVTALGRLRWSKAPMWMQQNITKFDPALAHAAMQTLRRSRNWFAVLRLLDLSEAKTARKIALRALANQYHDVIVDGLVKRLQTEEKPSRRREYAALLARIHKKPAAWKYWGYRPPPRPANTISWKKTPTIATALDHVLRDLDFAVRAATLRRMQREKVPSQPATLSTWLHEDRDKSRAGAVLQALGNHPAVAGRGAVQHVIRDEKHDKANRVTALQMFLKGLGKGHAVALVQLATKLEDGPVLADVLHKSARWPHKKTPALLVTKLTSPNAHVRAAAITSLATLKVVKAAPQIREHLHDKKDIVRRAAAAAIGKLHVKTAAKELLVMARENDMPLRNACLESLLSLKDRRVVPLAVEALNAPETQLCAIRCVAALGGPKEAKHLTSLAARTTSMQVLNPVIRALDMWSRQPGAAHQDLCHMMDNIQGTSGVLLRWQSEIAKSPAIFATGPEARVIVRKGMSPKLVSDFFLEKDTSLQFLAASNTGLRIALDGKQMHVHKGSRAYRPNSDRFQAKLSKGTHRVAVEVSATGNTQFHVHFRRLASKSELEKLTQAALARRGNVARGRDLFLNVKKTQCLKCHRLGETGERIGPDLIGLGKRFSRVHIIESILQPNRSIAPSYTTLMIGRKDGRFTTGTKLAENATILTLGDKDGKKHIIPKKLIATRLALETSVMPEGLERNLSEREFIDLVEFLTAQK